MAQISNISQGTQTHHHFSANLPKTTNHKALNSVWIAPVSKSFNFASLKCQRNSEFRGLTCSAAPAEKYAVQPAFKTLMGRTEDKPNTEVKKATKKYELNSEETLTSVDEPFILKKKSLEVAPYLHGRCIYLVGMMGSGKTTVGKILSEVLGYSFFDSDKLVEQAVGVTSVAQIFKEHSETFFRDNESEVLRELSLMRRLVVATGGGAVIRPINWKYMKQGLTVWLDVPLEALARRIAAVGTHSRPLLHDDSGDAYTKALMRLSTLSEERAEAYANADAKVSLEFIAAKLGLRDVCDLTPTAIAIEALVQIESFLQSEE